MEQNRRPSPDRNILWAVLGGWMAFQITLLFILLRRVAQLPQNTPSVPVTLPALPKPATVTNDSTAGLGASLGDSAQREKNSIINWDVFGVASATVALAGAAIFYVSGWMYEAQWYGYYGVPLMQISLDQAAVMIQGVPGIMLLSVSMLVAFGVVALEKDLSSTRMESRDITRGMLLAYALVVGVLIVALVLYVGLVPEKNTRALEPWAIGVLVLLLLLSVFLVVMIPYTIIMRLLGRPSEIQFSLSYIIGLIAFVVLGFYQALLLAEVPLIIIFSTATALLLLAIGVGIYRMTSLIRFTAMYRITPARLMACNLLLKHLSEKRDWWGIVRFSIFLFSIMVLPFRPLYHQEFLGELDDIERDLVDKFEAGRRSLLQSLSKTWQFSMSVVLLVLFLVSASASALLGVYDARRGARTLVGGWQIRKASIVSEGPIEALQAVLLESQGSTYRYGPLGLVSSTDSMLYLVSWKSGNYYSSEPTLYLIPKDKQNLVLEAQVTQPFLLLDLFRTPSGLAPTSMPGSP